MELNKKAELLIKDIEALEEQVADQKILNLTTRTKKLISDLIYTTDALTSEVIGANSRIVELYDQIDKK